MMGFEEINRRHQQRTHSLTFCRLRFFVADTIVGGGISVSTFTNNGRCYSLAQASFVHYLLFDSSTLRTLLLAPTIKALGQPILSWRIIKNCFKTPASIKHYFRTFRYVIILVPSIYVVSLAVALMLNSQLAKGKFFRKDHFFTMDHLWDHRWGYLEMAVW